MNEVYSVIHLFFYQTPTITIVTTINTNSSSFYFTLFLSTSTSLQKIVASVKIIFRKFMEIPLRLQISPPSAEGLRRKKII